MKPKTNSGLKIITLNRKAGFNFFFENFYEAGIVLTGSAVPTSFSSSQDGLKAKNVRLDEVKLWIVT